MREHSQDSELKTTKLSGARGPAIQGHYAVPTRATNDGGIWNSNLPTSLLPGADLAPLALRKSADIDNVALEASAMWGACAVSRSPWVHSLANHIG